MTWSLHFENGYEIEVADRTPDEMAAQVHQAWHDLKILEIAPELQQYARPLDDCPRCIQARQK